MEDHHLIITTDNDNALPPNHALFGVFDGHGGDADTDFVSRNMLPTLMRQESFTVYCQQQTQTGDLMEKDDSRTHRELLQQAMEQKFINLEYDLLHENLLPMVDHDEDLKKKKDGEDFETGKTKSDDNKKEIRRINP